MPFSPKLSLIVYRFPLSFLVLFFSSTLFSLLFIFTHSFSHFPIYSTPPFPNQSASISRHTSYRFYPSIWIVYKSGPNYFIPCCVKTPPSTHGKFLGFNFITNQKINYQILSWTISTRECWPPGHKASPQKRTHVWILLTLQLKIPGRHC